MSLGRITFCNEKKGKIKIAEYHFKDENQGKALEGKGNIKGDIKGWLNAKSHKFKGGGGVIDRREGGQ